MNVAPERSARSAVSVGPQASVFIRNAWARAAISRPIRPNPRIPSFFCASVRPAKEGHSPRRIAWSVCGMRRSTAIIRPKVSSMVERAIAPMVCRSEDAMPTSTPAFVAAAMST